MVELWSLLQQVVVDMGTHPSKAGDVQIDMWHM